MFERGLLLALLVLLASCVPPAAARHAEVPEVQAVSLETFRHLPAERIPEVIDTLTAPGTAAAPFAGGTDVTGRALDCLTAAVYYEARSEGTDGQRAVAQVVLNRVRHPAFPRGICGVVFQGAQRATGCQFSFTCDGAMRRAREPVAWERARDIAEAALAGHVYAPVGLATHFHTTAIHPWWASSMRRAVTVGSHIFYRWPGRWGDPMAFRRPYEGGEGGLPAQAAAATPSESPDTEMVMGVAIHRSNAPAPASNRPGRADLVQIESVQGVRIHRGGSFPPFETRAVDEPAPAGEGAAAALTR
ncbi:cell wall hydrolase [Sphingosinicella sp. LHD-64]|uniref:cell wall hydrolase n=1 Tax=Sphingosinicella sp. LHD-64 TaxID=3072139 RepID=UPI00280EADD7|nr:cell wall hydrolase [Sphingosinicella sp. LHD-64]MDQ8757869.1 cell wall hydrolase [Sphingosinicella sp. LHD-64]